MKQTLVPNNGYVLASRASTREFYGYRPSPVALGDEDTNLVYVGEGKYEHVRQIWAQVLDVGKSETTMYGTKITCDAEKGDFYAITNMGVEIPLEAGDGTIEFLTVIQFGGLLGRLEAFCDAPGCDYRSRKEPRILICPKCGAGPAVELVTPSLTESVAVAASRVRS